MQKIRNSLILLWILVTPLWGQTSISPEIQSKIKNSVFELVTNKIEDKNITYEKSLSTSSRTDTFTSIGTAFLLNDGSFWSAAHNFTLYGDTVYKNYYIRDSKGKTYSVDKITALSNTRDFISFTVPDFVSQNDFGLSSSDSFELNDSIFSVGQEQGKGIVIHDGMISDQTPEDFNGDWNWIKFSTSANSINSGSPLLNTDGAVIGIITKNNETMNYALPIKEIETGKNSPGYIDFRFYYRLPNILNKKEYHQFDYSIKLPATYTDLHTELTDIYKKQIETVFNKMKSEYSPDSPNGFGNSKEFPSISFNSFFSDTPMTLYLSNQGNWEIGSGTSKTYQLENNGSIEYLNLLNYQAFTITKPDSISEEKLVTTPQIYMDYITKVLNLKRTIGNSEITIKSFGQPSSSDTYTDYFGRTWFVNYYPVDFADSMIITYGLPLPTGMYVLFKMDRRSSITASHYLDMSFVADHTFNSYFGHIHEWEKYIDCGSSGIIPLSNLEKGISLNITDQQHEISMDNIKIILNDDYFPLSKDNRFHIRTGYSKKNGRTILENRGFLVYSNQKNDDYKYFGISKILKPIPAANKKIQEQWSQVKNKSFPYNEEPYNFEKFTFLNSILFPTENDNPDIIYELGFELLNQNKNDEIKAFKESVTQNLEIK